MSSVIVCPQSQLAEQIVLHRPSHIVTLTSGEVCTIAANHAFARLVLAFNDITEPRAGLVLPEVGHVAQLLDFVRAWPRHAPLLIHCHAGVSRSPAAAFITAAALMPEQDEARLAMQLRRLSPSATPNIRLIALADQLLARQGRMETAIRTIGRGADAFEGEVFSLPIRP
ncbi:tyrosine phosphatase family protein [Daeguia caeni]|uniref:Tyrosine phosphatase family protein n=1 Tax=Daeguia caeni TaxID=439612 RepID=A0ABV9H3S8_9HYPH